MHAHAHPVVRTVNEHNDKKAKGKESNKQESCKLTCFNITVALS